MAAETAARVIPIPPPLYYVVGLACGMALDALVTLPIGGRPVTTAIASTAIVAGLALMLGGVVAVIRHRTTIVPHHPVTTLVTGGAFRISRNPMYTGLAVAYLGTALLLDSWWPVALFPPVIAAVLRLAVQPEEDYLTQRFGQIYDNYRSGVRRWL